MVCFVGVRGFESRHSRKDKNIPFCTRQCDMQCQPLVIKAPMLWYEILSLGLQRRTKRMKLAGTRYVFVSKQFGSWSPNG